MSVWLGIEVQAVPRPTDMKHPRAAEGCYLLAQIAGYRVAGGVCLAIRRRREGRA